MMDIFLDLEGTDVEVRGVCKKCGLNLKNGKDICTRCEKSKIFLESCHVHTKEIKNKIFVLMQDVMEEIPVPKKGFQIRIRTQVSMNMLSYFLKILKKHNTVDCLTIATYSFDKSSLLIILDLVKSGAVKVLKLILSDTYSYRYKSQYEQLKVKMSDLKHMGYNVSLVFCTNHMKITLIQCGKDYYQIEGSMNYSVNNLCEQISIENCKETYDHDYKLLVDIIPDLKNKALEVVC